MSGPITGCREAELLPFPLSPLSLAGDRLGGEGRVCGKTWLSAKCRFTLLAVSRSHSPSTSNVFLSIGSDQRYCSQRGTEEARMAGEYIER